MSKYSHMSDDELFQVREVPVMRLHVYPDDNPLSRREPYVFGEKLHGRPFQFGYRHPKEPEHENSPQFESGD